MDQLTLKGVIDEYQAYKEIPGTTEEELKKLIAADPRNFSKDELKDIHAAIFGNASANLDQNPGADSSQDKPKSGDQPVRHVVKSEFRDISDFSRVYKVGSDVSGLDPVRLERLVELGYVEKR